MKSSMRKRTVRRSHRRGKRQRLWLQKGCSTRRCRQMKGGAAMQPALVGAPWTPSIKGWPGVAGVDGSTNYYSMNTYKNDPLQNIMQERQGSLYRGGRRCRSKARKTNRRSSKRGGRLVPQDLANFGSQLAYGV
jgi:hypothetical protein